MNQLSRNILNMARDPMCVPQLGNDPFRLKDETFAQSLMKHIDFVTSPNKDQGDPNDVTTIY